MMLPSETQRNKIDSSVAVTNSSATDYDSADESSVCSIPLPRLKKLDGVEPISGPKIIKSILRSKYTFKAEALKVVIINEPSSAPAKGNKSSSASKVHSALADGHYMIILLERKINPRNSQHAFKKCEACGSPNHTTTDHYDIEWKPIWYLDSGCSRHMTGVKSYLHKYMEQPRPKVVFGDDSTCTSEGYGSIKCNGIVFTMVAFVNRLKYNLISISQLYDAKYIVQLDEKKGTIFNSNKEIVMISPRVRDVYVLDMTSSTEEFYFFPKAFENLNWLWNKRLAHLNFKTINKLEKHHRASFKTKQTSSIKKCLHLLHMDLFGPVTPRSIDHEKYTLVIVDECSRYTWVYFLKKKSQAPETIMFFIKRVENQNDIKVKQLRTDNGTEFKNSTLVNFCDEKGISQNFSSLYTPEQNDVAEGKNRTLIEAARTMLSRSVFSKQYLTEAITTACYTQNRSTIMKRHLKTPYEIFCKRIPNISFLHVFGCPVYIHNHKDHLGKFDEKGDDGYLLGYSLVSKAFKVFNTRRQKTKEIYHITFDESSKAIKFSKPLVNNINIVESERYPPYEYLYPYEPSQRNKRDETKIVIKNKARLVAEGYNQQEGIDCDETFALVTRLKAIRIFLAFSTYMNFIVYQIDVKSAFLNGKLKEEVYVKQPLGFESNEFPNHVCKLDKALYGLKQALREWYETLSTFLIEHKLNNLKEAFNQPRKICQGSAKKYDINGSSVKTPMVPPNNLGPDLKGKSVNETKYRGVIGSLMYLTTSRPDIQFSTYLCVRYQVNPKESYLIAVKRIFKYLKGTLCLGLWYPKCSGFDLKGYPEPDYQSLAISSAEAKYVAAAGCYANILWIKSQLTDYEIIYEKETAGGPTSLGDTSEDGAHPQLSSGTKNYSFAHILAGSNPSVLVDKTKSVGDGLKTAHTTLSANEESGADDISQKVKLENLADILKDTRSAFFTPDSSTDEPIIVSDKKELEQVKVIAEVASMKSKPSYLDINQLTEHLVTSMKPELSKLLASHEFASCLPTELKDLSLNIIRLSREIKELKQHIKDMKIKLPGDLKEIPSKLEIFTFTISYLSSQVAEPKNIQWELPAEFLDLPHLASLVQEKLKTLDSLLGLLKTVTNTLNRFATLVENTSGATTTGVPSADKATASPAEGRKDAQTNLKNKIVDLLGKDIVTQYYNKKLLYERYSSALQVLRRLGSIFTSVYAAVYKAGKKLLYAKRNKSISLGKGASKVSRKTFDLTTMIVLQMGDVKKKSDAPMPYAMLLTRLYKYILQTNPQSIVSFDRFTYHEGGITIVVKETVEKDKLSHVVNTSDMGSYQPLPMQETTSAGNASESVRAISDRFANTAYGFFLGKRVAYPVVANYVRNTWGKYGLVRSMFSSSTRLFSFQFSSMDGLDAMLENGPWSSYARVMIELRADVELKDNIVVFAHIHEECLKNTEYRPVPKKPNASSSGNKKKCVEPTIEASNSNPFDVLNSIDNKMEFGTNDGTTNLVNNEATSNGSSFMNIDNNREFASNTPIVPTGIVESDSEVEVVFDETANLRISTSGNDESDKGYGTNVGSYDQINQLIN
nr:retrovirus-related Pol polyprotein from transposon TNT 1-94 [Tanacetum cinerariifolium]